MSSSSAQPNARVSSVITEQREAALQQLSSAWKLQVSRIEDALQAEWEERVGRMVEERFAELTDRVSSEFDTEVRARLEEELEASAAQIRSRVRRETAEQFQQVIRRLQAHQTPEEWAAALLDSTSTFATHSLLLDVQAGSVTVLRARGDASGAPAAGLSIPLAEAPAIAAAIESRDALIVVSTAGEVSAPVSGWFDRVAAANCAVVPVVSGERTVAVLLAAGSMDVNALEALASLAGIARRAPAEKPAAVPEPEEEVRPAIPRSQEAIHLKAQQFARVRAAEIRLYKSQAVRDGREHRRLYSELKDEIDSARDAYARKFLRASPSMPDYLHQELVRTLANEEVSALGEEYPGPLA